MPYFSNFSGCSTGYCGAGWENNRGKPLETLSGCSTGTAVRVKTGVQVASRWEGPRVGGEACDCRRERMCFAALVASRGQLVQPCWAAQTLASVPSQLAGAHLHRLLQLALDVLQATDVVPSDVGHLRQERHRGLRVMR